MLLYTPERFGLSRIGDLLDAMKGYIDARAEVSKQQIEIVRRATTILWNTQVIQEDRLIASELWPLPWDKETGRITVISDEERQRVTNAQIEHLNKFFPS